MCLVHWQLGSTKTITINLTLPSSFACNRLFYLYQENTSVLLFIINKTLLALPPVFYNLYLRPFRAWGKFYEFYSQSLIFSTHHHNARSRQRLLKSLIPQANQSKFLRWQRYISCYSGPNTNPTPRPMGRPPATPSHPCPVCRPRYFKPQPQPPVCFLSVARHPTSLFAFRVVGLKRLFEEKFRLLHKQFFEPWLVYYSFIAWNLPYSKNRE